MQAVMHAFLITGGERESRISTVEKLLSEHDVLPHNALVLAIGEEETSIGIAAVREWERALALSGYGSGNTAGIIYHAHLLTAEAQQALLKTVEEPPASCIIVLETETPALLLPTIVSRVWQLPLPHKSRTQHAEDIKKTLAAAVQNSTGHIFSLSETVAGDKESAAAFIEQTIHTFAAELTGKKRTSYILRLALTAQKQLAANVNPKLVIDTFLLGVRAGQA